MKKSISLFILIFVAFTYMRCTDLEENPKGLMAPEGFFKTPSDVEAAVNGAYAEFVHMSIERLWTSLMLRSDMLDIGDLNTTPDYITINNFTMEANNSMTTFIWEQIFKGISAANTAIKAAQEISADEEIKNELEAKARFIRGIFYYHLVRCFGPVPYLDSPVSSLEEIDAISRTPENEIYEYIINDFIFAKANLPIANPGGARNIGTKGSAATALADVYLTLNQYDKALIEAKFVIVNAGNFNYGLEQNYQDLFNANLAGTLKEPIFTYDLKNTLNQGEYNPVHGLINFTRIRDYGPRSLSIVVPSLKVYQTWDDRDYRKKVCFEDSVIVNGKKVALTNTNFRVPRPHVAKYFRYPGPQEGGDDRSSDHRYPIYRYADVLLIAAEAIAESQGVTAEAINYINQIRERARFNGTTLTDFPADVEAGISNEDFIQVVREERRLEFAFEFKRWYDIKRWGTLEEAFTSSDSFEPHNVDKGRDYLFPIPQTEIDVTNFNQNSGY